MNRACARVVITVLSIVLVAAPAPAQYFGKNKISYEEFDWLVYRSPHFDVHYYPAMEPFLEEIVSYAESAYVKISRDLDHELRFRVPLVVFKTHGEFQQTNITLAELPQGVAAFAEPVQYRIVLPIDQPPDKLSQLIAHELVHIFQYSIFFEGYLGRALRSRAPYWLMEGMASYLAQDEDNLDRMAIRDAVVNNVLPPIEALDVLSFLTYRYGHAIFDYIEQEHGKEGLRGFLFEYKKVLLSNNIGKAIKEAFGYDVDEFNRRFNRYLRKKYFPVLLEKKSPDDYGTEIGGSPRGDDITFSPSLSPSGELIAALSVPRMDLDLVVVSAEDGKRVRNLTKGWTNDYRHLVADVFEGKRDVSWSPVADEIVVFARRENSWPLLVFHSLTGRKLHDVVFDDIFECSSPVFSPDGRRVAFEGNRNGVVDIFQYDLETGELGNLTQDDFFDANPWYSADGSTLLYNRRIGPHWKIFAVDLADPSKKTQLTVGPHSDLQPSYSRDGRTVYFSSDRGPYGVFNLYSLDLASGDIRQFTDVVGGCFSPVEMAERDGESHLVFTAFYQGSFRLYRMPLHAPELEIEAGERATETAEAEPFEPPLRLTVDEAQKAPYKVKWDLEAPSFTVGVTDDGTFLSDVGLQFSDLMGDRRLLIQAGSVSDYASYGATYLNLEHRHVWGATAYDYRDYFIDGSTGTRLRRRYQETAANVFLQYPFTRHYRVEGALGLMDSAYNQYVGTSPTTGQPLFVQYDDRLATAALAFVGDTTRYQSFGPFQGKRFSVGARYGAQLSGDYDGNWLEYRADYRAYRQLTNRSLLAWRVSTIWNAGEREPIYGFGGINQLRGWEYRDFYGSRIAWTNLELRFPLIDEMRFPVLALQQIRGFFFLDAGAAWFQNGSWYDPVTNTIRADYSQPTPEIVKFKFWDSDNDRLQDGRAAYGFGFQFFFIGGLQFNWVWSRRFDYTQFLYDVDGSLIPTKADTGDTRSDFYILFDF